MNENIWIFGNDTIIDEKVGSNATYFRKEFTVDKKTVKRVSISLSALGLFKGYINGLEIDNDRLLPGWTNYDKRVIKYTFDITNKIEVNNCISIILGNGWYSGKIGGSLVRYNYGKCPKLFVSIVIKYEDHEEIIDGKNGWKYSEGSITSNDLFDGEVYDQNLDLGEFSKVNYDDKLWKDVNYTKYENIDIIEDYGEKTCVIDELKYVSKKIVNDKTIYDFGQNISGVVKAKIVGNGKVTFRYAEILDADGNIYTDNLREAKATDIFYSSKGGEYSPLFTYHGFRYIEITTEENVKVEDIKALVISSNIQKTGEFNCSNNLFNQIYSNTRWGQICNFISIPTDCPQRDERLGWTGDCQVFCKTAMYNSNCLGFYNKFVDDIITEQFPSGAVPVFVPMQNFKFKKGFSAWGDAITILPYRVYQVYNDIDILRRAFPAMVKWVNFCKSHSFGYICNCKGYGDWLTPNVKGAFNSVHATSKNLISTAYFANSAYITYKTATILNNKEQAGYFLDLFNKIKKWFRSVYLKRNGFIKGNQQTAYVLAYKFNLVTLDEIRQGFLNSIQINNNHINCGFLGTQYLYDLMCDLGKPDIAYQMMNLNDYPSLGFQIKNGATTIWERWDGYTPEKGFREPIMNSFNHYSLGACSSWFYEYVLGFRIGDDNVGMNKVVLRPYLDTTSIVNSAKGCYDGVSVEWNVKDNIYTYSVEDTKNREIDIDFFGFKIDNINKEGNKVKYTLSVIE